MMFLVQCPHCRNRMRYDSRKQLTKDSRKKCVYCPKSFLVHDHIVPPPSG